MAFTNSFIGLREKPSASELKEVLSASQQLWNAAIEQITDISGALTQEWKCYGRNSGWVLKLIRNKQTVAYLSPSYTCFGVSVVLSASATAALKEYGAPADLVKIVANARHYVEGTPVLIEVRTDKDIQTVLCLVRAKLHLSRPARIRSSAATR